MRFALSLLFALSGTPTHALDLELAGASVVHSETSPADSVRLPIAPYSTSSPPPQAEGQITRTVLRTADGSRTTLQLLAPLREQLNGGGYDTVFECEDRACGGFDFRFELDLIPAPEMFVDLGDFRYLLMQKPGLEPHTVSIVTSRSSDAGFVHLTFVGTMERNAREPVVAPDVLPVSGETSTMIEDLIRIGHTVLPGVDFASGTSTLPSERIISLVELGEWLEANPSARIALVGHTDSIGDGDANEALSQRRARAVRDWILENFRIVPTRIEADGVGYLAPVAPNSTAEGRATNRRVEAVLLTAE